MVSFMVFNVALTVFACFLFWWRERVKKFQRAIKTVQEAYRTGEYETGLQLAENLKRGRSTPSAYWFCRGKMLYQLGQLEEAESCLQKSLSMETEPRKKALAREALGKVLMEQKRYDEAMSSFEVCIEEAPDHGSGHRALAEAWLRQGVRDGEALSFARLAVKTARTTRAITRQIREINLSEGLATLAWAVAVQSADAAEVERQLQEAFPLVGAEYKPIRAHLHYLAGVAYSALGTTDAREKSARHFQQAAAGDPEGNFGRLAQAALPEAAA